MLVETSGVGRGAFMIVGIASLAGIGSALATKAAYISSSSPKPFGLIAVQFAVLGIANRCLQVRSRSAVTVVQTAISNFSPSILRRNWPIILAVFATCSTLNMGYVALPLPVVHSLHIIASGAVLAAHRIVSSAHRPMWVVGGGFVILLYTAVLHIKHANAVCLGAVAIGCLADAYTSFHIRQTELSAIEVVDAYALPCCLLAMTSGLVVHGPAAIYDMMLQDWRIVALSGALAGSAHISRAALRSAVTLTAEAAHMWIVDLALIWISISVYSVDTGLLHHLVAVFIVATIFLVLFHYLVPGASAGEEHRSSLQSKLQEAIKEMRQNMSRRAVLIIGMVSLLGGLIWGISTLNHSSFVSNWMSDSDFIPSRSVRFPLNGEIKHHDPNDGKLSLFTQTGPGLEVIPPYDDTVDPRTLPRLGWVVFVTADSLAKDGHQIQQIQCYCAMMGIPFYLEHRLLLDDRHLFTARHRGIAKYLRYHQWMFATDADMLIANSEVDIRKFLDDSKDVIANDRGTDGNTWEVCACALLVKNSPGGWSFLRRWVSWADFRQSPNYDNGDLLEIITTGMNQKSPANNAHYTGRVHPDDEPKDWDSNFNETLGCVMPNKGDMGHYKWNFVACFQRTVAPLRYGNDKVPHWDVNLFGWTDVLPPIAFRSYKTFAGFCRWGWDGWYKGAWDGVILYDDFMITGKSLVDFITPDAALCSGKGWSTALTVDREAGRGKMMDLGITWWPHCFDEEGTNLCLRPQAVAS